MVKYGRRSIGVAPKVVSLDPPSRYVWCSQGRQSAVTTRLDRSTTLVGPSPPGCPVSRSSYKGILLGVTRWSAK